MASNENQAVSVAVDHLIKTFGKFHCRGRYLVYGQ